MSAPTDAERRDAALAEYRKKLLKHSEVDTKVRALREDVKKLRKEYDKTEDDLKALQSVGQIIGEVLRQLDEERCERRARAARAPLDACARRRGSLQPGRLYAAQREDGGTAGHCTCCAAIGRRRSAGPSGALAAARCRSPALNTPKPPPPTCCVSHCQG